MSEQDPKLHKDSTSEEPPLMPHSFDGIQEYDSRLPNWWLMILYVSIIFFVIFWFGKIIFGILPMDTALLEEELKQIEQRKHALLTEMMKSIDDDKFWEMSRDPALVAKGEATYQSNCSACHAPDLSAQLNKIALPGLPLNDAEWKYGNKPMNIFKIVREGSPDVTKGMVAWEPALGAVKVAEVVAYLLSKQSEDNGKLMRGE